MATTTRKNATTKAIQSAMAKAKKNSPQALIEWELSCNTNNARGHIYDQHELFRLYDQHGQACGASKATHTECHNGNPFQYIVIKRHKRGGYMPNVHGEHAKCTGNQLVDEINCWLEFAERPESDYLCPILKYFTSKSDKVASTSKTMVNNVIIISQKAVYVDDARGACECAEKLNAKNGFKVTPASIRYNELKAFSTQQGWRDAMYNGGNSGVIFDYAKNCFKAVFIDYAL